MLNIGAMIHHYKVLSLIGKGGMGEVYQCEDTMIGRMVAIKVLNPALSNDEGLIKRFKQEARIQVQLTHPHIVNLHAMMEFEGKLLIIMEYVPGMTLKDLIARTGPIPEQRSLHILRQLVEALSYAHSKNIIHRDIKPSNIILDDADNAKILDFGIAKVMGEHGLTSTGSNIGTILYMSPEQIQTPKTIDHRSDLFSLGITFFEMLSGKLPYNTQTDSDFALQSQIVRNELPDPREFYQFISQPTVDIMRRMTARDVNHRFYDAAEILGAIMGSPTDWQRPRQASHRQPSTEQVESPAAEVGIAPTMSFWQQPWVLWILRVYYIRSIVFLLNMMVMLVLVMAEVNVDTREIRVLEYIMGYEYLFLLTNISGLISVIFFLANDSSYWGDFYGIYRAAMIASSAIFLLIGFIINLQLLIRSFRIKPEMAASDIRIVRFRKKQVFWMITFAIIAAALYLVNRYVAIELL